MVARSADLDSLISDWGAGRDITSHRLMTGWRGELIGQELSAVLEGKLTVGAHPQTGELQLIRKD